VVCRCTLSRNLVNEDPLASVGPQHHSEKKGVNSKYNYVYMIIVNIITSI